MSAPILYSQDISPPCRAVLLLAEAIGVKLDVRNVDLFKQETCTEEFLKMNPQHTIPTLNDNGYILWDSHAIVCYLVSKYAKNDALYPKDIQKRGTVDQCLHFNNATLFAVLRNACKPIAFGKTNTVSEEKIQLIEDALGILEKYLEGKKWLVGDSYTVADITAINTVMALEFLMKMVGSQKVYPNIQAWVKRCEENLPGFEKLALPGKKEIEEMFVNKISKKM